MIAMNTPYDSVKYRSLENRSVLITGGASGIGASLVEAFVAQGSRVSFLDVDVPAATALSNRTGATFIHCDLLDIAALRAAIRVVEAAQQGIAVLVNNAGKDDRQEFKSIEPEAWRLLLALNLDHQFFASQAGSAGRAGRDRDGRLYHGKVRHQRLNPHAGARTRPLGSSCELHRAGRDFDRAATQIVAGARGRRE